MERNDSYQRRGGIRRSSSLLWRNNSSQGPFGSTRLREKEDEEETLLWAAIERLPTYDRLRKGIMVNTSDGVGRQVELQELGLQERKELVDRLVNDKEIDNKTFLMNLKNRIERARIDIPTVEVRFEHLKVEAEAHNRKKTLPTLSSFTTNVLKDLLKLLRIIPGRKKCLPILQDISGVVEPKRMTLLLGPPSSGKTTLLLALAGKLDKDLKVSGKVTYNGHGFHEFIPQKTAAYVSQTDLHYGEMTVRETLEYSARFQGVGHRYEMLAELSRREKAEHVKPDPDIDLFMKAAAVGDQKASIQTDYILKMLGLEGCADTIVGNEMIRGISGGQKRRVTIGEILVGPASVLLMDEISTGLDSATTYRIMKNLQQFVHILHGTALISLLQPTPETYNLFDNILLLSDCEIIYQGPLEHVLEFFELMGFQCPQGKGIAYFLQEVISWKDQQRYWVSPDKPYRFIAPKEFAREFKSFHVGEELRNKLANPFDKSKNHPAALVTRKYGSGNKDLLKTCFTRELLLLKRNSFVYISKLILLSFMAFITMTVFLRSEFHKESVTADGGIYLGALYCAVSTIFFTAGTEMPVTIIKLPVFYKQRDLLFFPSWAFSLAIWIVKIPISFIEAGVWVFITYYVVGFDSNVQRFFRQFFVLGALHQAATGLYRVVAGVSRNMTVTSLLCPFCTIVTFSLGGFILSHDHVKKWWIWGYWCSPYMYAQSALVVNEFLGESWRNVLQNTSRPLGVIVIKSRGVLPHAYWYWIGVGALFGFTILYNVLYGVALAFLNPFVSHQGVSVVEAQKGEEDQNTENDDSIAQASLDWKIGMILPFEPHSITFDEVWYSIDIPQAMKNQGVLEDRLNLLKGVSGSFRPGVLSALMGVSGAGKTTLMDVLAGRKTGGYIEGDIRISGYPIKHQTFARISGYCEQNDIHSPHVTVYESLLYSACLRLSPQVNSHTREMFVQEVMDLVELTPLSGALVGLPGVNGISLEQRKRLTIAVELVANPSIIFMDEPTSGLDARIAAIVMTTVRKIVDTERTIVCTIHQPSIDIFEAFDEIFLLRQGGEEIYAGPLGRHSSHIISYFESIEGVSKIKEGYNPASWIFEVTTPAQELYMGVDFVEIYKKSELYRRNKTLIQELSTPNLGSKDLCFKTQYPQPLSAQLTLCIWKQNLLYWRNPPYNAARLFFTIIIALLMGTMFWGLGGKVETRQDLINAMGSAYAAFLYIGAQNLWAVQPVVAIERVVVYRERAGRMYSVIPYALAQIIIEIPYVLLQSATYSIMVYAMMGFEWTALKFFSYTFFLFFNLLFCTYFGMVIVVVTPNPYFADILAFGSVLIWNLFSGFLIPRKMILIWWRWFYWLCPNSWGLYGLVASQYGDLENVLDSGETVKDFLDEYFGFNRGFLGPVSAAAVGLAVAAAFLFVISIKTFNFQSR